MGGGRLTRDRSIGLPCRYIRGVTLGKGERWAGLGPVDPEPATPRAGLAARLRAAVQDAHAEAVDAAVSPDGIGEAMPRI